MPPLPVPAPSLSHSVVHGGRVAGVVNALQRERAVSESVTTTCAESGGETTATDPSTPTNTAERSPWTSSDVLRPW